MSDEENDEAGGVGEGCIEGMKCPECGQHEEFKIAGTSVFKVTEDGTDFGGDVEWDNQNYAECPECGWSGTVRALYPMETPRNAEEVDALEAVKGDDARLIAAAPDLLEALRELLAQAEGPAMIYGDGIGNSGVKDGLSHEEFNALRSRRLEAARAAIAKAAGA